MNVKNFDKNFVFDKSIKIDYKYFIKRLLLPFWDVFYSVLIKLNTPKKKYPRKYQLVICAIFKNEAIFLKEWIEYHRIIGVEHFYLYNNFSNDEYEMVLRPYIDIDLVTLIDWPINQGQMLAYEHFWKNYRAETQWVTFIDIDEFYCPYNCLDLKKWLKKFKDKPSVVVYWMMFGTSGNYSHDYNRPVIEQYVVSWNKMYSVGKVFINTDWNFFKMYHHCIEAKCELFGISFRVPSVNEFGKYLKWDYIPRSAVGKARFSIQLNHYWTKSFEETINRKFKRGDVALSDAPTHNLDAFYFCEHNCCTINYKIYRFMIQLKLAMGIC
ncbi:glycosyltransferase family 92 protein [Bacteroides sp.]|uniref:glycosyltransferase family 92 protein n=1 Tax=Bacteroides sp. TaxID=29523 RepID=UPI003528366D